MGAVTLYRLHLQPHSATLSPWQADTLFGHLCWEAFYKDGARGLEDFLAPFRDGAPPFVLSEGFPDDKFPRPLVPPQPWVRASKAESENAMADAKKDKGVVWLTQPQFEQMLRGESPPLSGDPTLFASPRLVLKNQINRFTGTTAGAEEDEEAGNLYSATELRQYRTVRDEQTHTDKQEPVPVTIYMWAESPAKAGEAKGWFDSLARGGYGKKKSVGYGRFDVLPMDSVTLTVPDDANGFVALANFAPAATDPTDGYYKTRVKYGKIGEAAILNGTALSPYKIPLVMLTAGSTFRSDQPHNYVGQLVTGIHRENDTIVQGAFAPVVPMRLPETED